MTGTTTWLRSHRVIAKTEDGNMVDEEKAVNVGDVYTNRDLDLTYRVVEVREEGGDEVVTVETLEEGVETYRTVEEIVEMIEDGIVVETEVEASEFETVDEEEFEIDLSVDNKKYLKGGAVVLVALFLSAVLLPVAGIFLKIAAKFLVPVAIVALGAYLMYRKLSEQNRI